MSFVKYWKELSDWLQTWQEGQVWYQESTNGPWRTYWHDLINYSWILSNIGRNCAIEFKLGRKVKYDTRNPLLVQEGRIDMISLIIHVLSNMGRNCPIDFKLGTKVKYDNRNPLPVQEGRTDMISSIIHEFFQIWHGIVRLTSNLVGRSSMMPGIHYRSKKDVLTWIH